MVLIKSLVLFLPECAKTLMFSFRLVSLQLYSSLLRHFVPDFEVAVAVGLHVFFVLLLTIV